jgi:phosphonate transport system ATP-binding protein
MTHATPPGADARQHVVDARALTKRYPNGTVGLSDLDLTVDPGEMVAVLGPSGSGKTTLFRLCNAAIRPTSGELCILGRSVTGLQGGGLRALRRQVAVVYQGHNLVESMSVLKNVLVGRLGQVPVLAALRSALMPSAEEAAQVCDLLEALGIPDKLYTRVDELSGGQKQRVAIARALFQRPGLLLADEPVASVDDETATVILRLLTRVRGEQGMTVLVSLHQRQYVERYCDRAVELRRGTLMQDVRFPRNEAPTPAGWPA